MENQDISCQKAVFFDLDGTLVNLGVNWEDVRVELRNLFEKYRISMDFEPLLSKMEDAIKRVSTEFSEKDANRARETGWGIIEAHEIRGAHVSELMEHAKEIIDFLKKKGFYVGVISRNSRRAIEVVVKKHKIDVDIIVSRDDIQLTKPHPDPILHALKKLNINPVNVLMVGDHPFDIMSGKDAGVTTVGILTGNGTEKELKTAGADFIFKNLKEFEQFLDDGDENSHS